MSLLRTEKDNFDAMVLYVFDEEGEIRVLDETLDIKVLKATLEEKAKMEADDKISAASNIPFNRPVNLEKYEEKDIRKAVFTFRKPVLDDMPLLLSSFININASGEMSPGDVYEFSNRKIKLLFIKGKAQDVGGNEVKITKENLGKIPPVLGSAMSVKMSMTLNM